MKAFSPSSFPSPGTFHLDSKRYNFVPTATPLTVQETMFIRNGYLVAIDAEFVSINQEETEIRSDGTKSLIRPTQLSLARVSVLRGEGSSLYVPFIDDYIYIKEMVMDYLTEYSGIQRIDLDPNESQHNLVPLKVRNFESSFTGTCF